MKKILHSTTTIRTIEILFILFLIGIAAFLRLYRFTSFMIFLDDQGRDVLIAQRIFVHQDLTLLGPRTSVGNMYLGPLYYYWIVPFLMMTYPNPVGPALMIAFLGILTVFFIYHFGKRLFGKEMAYIAAITMAVAPTTVDLSRFSWQPNPAPFVGLLAMYCSYLAVRKNIWWWVAAAGCFAVLSQLHYVALLSAIPLGIVFLIQTVQRIKRKAFSFKTDGVVILLSIGIMLLSTTPLIIFDFRHNHTVSNGFLDFFHQLSQEPKISLGQRLFLFWADIKGTGFRIMIELLGVSRHIGIWKEVLLLGYAILQGTAIVVAKTKKMRLLGFGLLLWVWSGVICLAWYRQTLYEHYFAYLFPAVFLLFGYVCSTIAQRFHLMRYVIYAGVIILVAFHIVRFPIFTRERPQGIKDLQVVATGIQDHLRPSDRYNLALLNDNREYMGMKYRYYLSTMASVPQSEYVYENLDKLVVIVENKEEPLVSPIHEIQQFVRESGGNPTLVASDVFLNGAVHVFIYERSTANE